MVKKQAAPFARSLYRDRRRATEKTKGRERGAQFV
jgi:hypothetical protein